MEGFNESEKHESKEAIQADSTFYPLVNEQLQKRYDRIATRWNTEAYSNTRRDDLIPTLIETASIKDGHRVLEAMCGTALVAQKIEERYPNALVCGLDFSIGMLNQIPHDVFRVQASVLGMPFDDETFDRIILRTAIYDLPRRMQRNALAELHRILKNDSIFVLQTYVAEPNTVQILNEIANTKDRLAGQYQDMGKESPRYFATQEEFNEWFDKVGFKSMLTHTFSSEIQLQKASEMTDDGKRQFSRFMESLPKESRKAIRLKIDDDGNCTYELSGVIWKLIRET